jgi:hypothetical protein
VVAASIHLGRDVLQPPRPTFIVPGRWSRVPIPASTSPGVERLEDSLTNAVYRVIAIGSRESSAVRVFTNHHESMAKETAVLDALNGRLPVPERLATHPVDRMLPHACVIYRRIPGITLNTCRQQPAPAALAGQRGGKQRLRPLT